MSKWTWIFASVLSALVVIGFIGLTAWQQERDLEKARTELSTARGTVAKQLAQAAALREELAGAKEQIGELQREKEAVMQTQKSLEQEMRNALESKDITISQLQGKLTVNILDRILFDSGEAVLRLEGEKVLQKIAGILAPHPQRQIHVIGHTDNVPIRASARNRFPSNWELSTARATAAVRFLCEQAGVDPHRLGAVGYGEYHPIADNSTPEGRAKNRRIALVVLSEELVGADVPPAITVPVIPLASPSIPTNDAPAAPAPESVADAVAPSNAPAAPLAPAGGGANPTNGPGADGPMRE